MMGKREPAVAALLLALVSCAPDPAGRGGLLGQKPPGSTPALFAPGTIPGAGYRLHGFPAFSPGGNEVYWPVLRIADGRPEGTILWMEREGDSWRSPRPFLHAGGYMEQAPCFSPDGERLYFQSARPGGIGSLDIWYVERIGKSWSEPVNPGPPLNSEGFEAQPSVTVDGTVYFAGRLEGAAFDRGIYRSRFVDGRYLEPELLGDSINTEYIDAYPFISPDERVLLFSSSRPSTDEEEMRLFVSFRTEPGGWTIPVDLSGAMGFDRPSRFPCLSPDGAYLLFCSGDSVYWVDAEVVGRLRPGS